MTGEGKRMAKKGRPFVYQSETEKPVTVSVRVPRGLYEQIDRHVKMRPGMTMTEFFLDGARLRLDTPADPRDLILSDDNTVIQELQEMIRAEVQAEIGKLHTFMESARDALKLVPAAEPMPDMSYDSNAVIHESGSPPLGKRGDMRQRIVALLREHPGGLTAVEIKVHLRATKALGDTLQGMVRQQLLTKQGRGNTVRYLALEA
jgi:hypothetical protein